MTWPEAGTGGGVPSRMVMITSSADGVGGARRTARRISALAASARWTSSITVSSGRSPATITWRKLRRAAATRSRRSAGATGRLTVAPSRISIASSRAATASSISSRPVPARSKTWRSRWVRLPRALSPRPGGRLSEVWNSSVTSENGASVAAGVAATATRNGFSPSRAAARATNSATSRLLPRPARPVIDAVTRQSSRTASARASVRRSSSASRPTKRPRRSRSARSRSSKLRGPTSSSTRRRRRWWRRAGRSRKA